MMIYAYQEMYLSKAQAMLGDAFDYAVNVCNISGNDFTKLFLASSASERMENGEISYIAGKSGGEIEPCVHFERTKEYWIGWAIAYYQWYSDRKYSEILKAVPYENLEKMYYTLHEADISKFVDIMDSRMTEFFSETNLKRIRMIYGFTQKELANNSGVTLRSIQMYEQGHKNINKASAETLYRLSKILGCTMEDLMEK